MWGTAHSLLCQALSSPTHVMRRPPAVPWKYQGSAYVPLRLQILVKGQCLCSELHLHFTATKIREAVQLLPALPLAKRPWHKGSDCSVVATVSPVLFHLQEGTRIGNTCNQGSLKQQQQQQQQGPCLQLLPGFSLLSLTLQAASGC